MSEATNGNDAPAFMGTNWTKTATPPHPYLIEIRGYEDPEPCGYLGLKEWAGNESPTFEQAIKAGVLVTRASEARRFATHEAALPLIYGSVRRLPRGMFGAVTKEPTTP